MDGRLRTGKPDGLSFMDLNPLAGMRATAWSFAGTVWRYDARNWNFHTGIFDVSQNFDTRLGYVTRTGITTIPVVLVRNFYYEKKALQRLSPYYWSRQGFDHAAKLWETLNIFGIELGLPRQVNNRLGLASQ